MQSNAQKNYAQNDYFIIYKLLTRQHNNKQLLICDQLTA